HLVARDVRGPVGHAVPRTFRRVRFIGVNLRIDDRHRGLRCDEGCGWGEPQSLSQRTHGGVTGRSNRGGVRWTPLFTIGLLKPLERPGVLGEALQVFLEYPLSLRVASGFDEYAAQILAYRNAPLRRLAVDELVLELRSVAKVSDRRRRVALGLRDVSAEHLGRD